MRISPTTLNGNFARNVIVGCITSPKNFRVSWCSLCLFSCERLGLSKKDKPYRGRPRGFKYLLTQTIIDGAPAGTRTPNPQVRSLVLYPVELRAQHDRSKPNLASAAPMDQPIISYAKAYQTWLLCIRCSPTRHRHSRWCS